MSSNTYSAQLTPDPWLRIVVLTSGRLLFAAGLAIIVTLQIDPFMRFAGSLLWLSIAHYELSRLRRGFRFCAAIRVHFDGVIEVLDADGEWSCGRLLDGSVLLQEFAWMRVRTSTGLLVVELLRGDARRNQDWRRLQVIWRHVGASP